MGPDTPQGGGEGEIGGQGGEGREAERVSPPLGDDDVERGRTEAPSPPDDELHEGEQDPGHP